jgi:O-antigen/teichoic acid export membrane protein
MSRWKSVKNAFANVCRGSTNALVMVLLPYFLTRQLPSDVYGTWFLILQISSYISFLDFGVQTAVGRFVAYYNELQDFQQRDKTVITSIAILSGLSILGAGAILAVSLNLHHLFREMPTAIESDAKASLMILGLSLAIALPFSVFGALFIGIQRYDVPAWIIGVTRLLGGIAVVCAARENNHPLIAMALAMGVFNIASALCQYAAYRRMLPLMNLQITNLSFKAAQDVLEHCSSLVIWNLSLVLVSYIDALVIGYFDYKFLPYYSLVSVLISFVVGVQASIFSTILPSAATISARQDGILLGKLFLSTTRYAVGVLVISSSFLFIFGYGILEVWAGKDYADQGIILLHLLVIANSIRQLGGPYSMIVMAVGEQRKILLSPLIEGIANFIFSVVLTSYFGVYGVAWGTLLGSLISVLWHFMYNLPKTTRIVVKKRQDVLRAIFYPMMSVIPSTLYVLKFEHIRFSTINFSQMIPVFFTIACTFTLLYYLALNREERYALTNVFIDKLKKKT